MKNLINDIMTALRYGTLQVTTAEMGSIGRHLDVAFTLPAYPTFRTFITSSEIVALMMLRGMIVAHDESTGLVRLHADGAWLPIADAYNAIEGRFWFLRQLLRNHFVCIPQILAHTEPEELFCWFCNYNISEKQALLYALHTKPGGIYDYAARTATACLIAYMQGNLGTIEIRHGYATSLTARWLRTHPANLLAHCLDKRRAAAEADWVRTVA